MNYEKGSEWRKWDLHVHSPKTHLNNQFNNCTINQFVKKVVASDLAAIGLTNYFRFCDDEISEIRDKLANKGIVVFPNLELRTQQENKQGEEMHVHIVFTNTIDITKISNFLGRLKTMDGKYCNNLESHEISNVTVSFETLKDALTKDGDIKHYEDYLLVACPRGQGSFRPGSRSGRGDTTARSIDEWADVLFGNNNDRSFFLNENRFNGASPKPVLLCSDAHSLDDIGKKFSWIKSDPTFEGLKQIICEPEDRVKIQENKPEEKNSYQVIKSIRADIGNTDIGKICKQTIQFNPNLNTIIGGRSTGKSTLLQIIARKIDSEVEINDFAESIVSDTATDITVVWQDGEEDKDRDIEFFPQNHMHIIANEEEKKDDLIKNIIKVTEKDDLIKEHERFCATNRDVLQANVDNLFKLQNYLDQLREELKEKGDKDGLEKEIKSLNKKIDDIQKDDDFSTDQKREYEEAKQKISECEQREKKLVEDIEQIKFLKDQDLFNTSFGYKFNQLSDLNSSDIEKIFEDIKQESEKIWRKHLTDKLRDINKQIKKYENDIKNEKNSESFKRGAKYLEKNNQYKELNDRLTIEKRKLTEIKSIQRKITETNKQIQTLLEETIDNHSAYDNKNNQLSDEFLLEHDDIAIKIKKIYQEDKCEELLKDFINLQSHERQKFVTGWSERYKANIKTEIADFLTKALNKNIELKAYKNIKDLTKGLLVENWFSISYELTYQNDIFENMSDGKKAFVILKLLLEFSNKKCPILIDQPEDSLDNRAIYNELVTYIRKKKKERQIILVTHNANIVVNADAEEVVVANQHGSDSKNKNDIQFQYVSGSLENTHKNNEKRKIILYSQGIREHVCELLEGGVEAFAKRENKYGIRRVMK